MTYTHAHCKATKKYQNKRVALGLCTQCGQPRSETSKRLCEKHRLRKLELDKRKRETNKYD